jgi:hypothetical protein
MQRTLIFSVTICFAEQVLLPNCVIARSYNAVHFVNCGELQTKQRQIAALNLVLMFSALHVCVLNLLP